jgi:hypothetical protein
VFEAKIRRETARTRRCSTSLFKKADTVPNSGE